MQRYLYKYIIPLLSGIVVLFINHLISEHYDVKNYRLNLLITGVVLFVIVVRVIKHIPGPPLNIPFLDRMLNAPPKPIHDLKDFITPDAAVITYSKSKSIFFALMFAFFALVGVYSFVRNLSSPLANTIVCLFGCFGVYEYSRRVWNTPPLLVLSSDGIVTPQFGRVPWSHVKKVQRKYTTSGESSGTDLEIFFRDTEEPQFSLGLSGLNIGDNDLVKQVEKYTKTKVEFVS